MPGAPDGFTQSKSRRRSDFSLSLVIPVFNEQACITPLVGALRNVLSGITERWEIIFVDDHSNDSTLDIIDGWSAREPRIKAVRLPHRQGQHTALASGLEVASGDAVITMDADLQHPPRYLPEMVRQWRQGFDVVNMIRDRHGNRGYASRTDALLVTLFYRLFNLLSGTTLTPGISEFRLLDSHCVEEIRRMPERFLYPKALIPRLASAQTELPFVCPPRRHGQAAYTLPRRVAVALKILASFSLRRWRSGSP